MTYKPSDVTKATAGDFPALVQAELGKIAAEFAAVQQAPAPTPPAPLWSSDFTSFKDFFEQAKALPRATLVTVGGVNAIRLHTESGDNNVAGSGDAERDDLSTSQATSDGYEGREAWWAHSVLFPDDYIDPPMSPASAVPWHFGVVADFHNTTPGGGQANFQMEAMPVTGADPGRATGLNFKMSFGDQTKPTEERHYIGPVVRNVWYDCVYHVRWASDASGFFDAWVDGVRKMSYKGPTLYAGQGVYLKLANYHSAFGKASSVLHGKRVARGATAAAVTSTVLQGV